MGEAISCFVFSSRNPFKSDMVCGEFQTPSVNLVVSIFAI